MRSLSYINILLYVVLVIGVVVASEKADMKKESDRLEKQAEWFVKEIDGIRGGK